MAKSAIRSISAQETTIQEEESSELASRYECPICIHWLKEPVLTSCGHRFCKQCLLLWLKTPNPTCPIDNKILSENDIFPDNFTKREIQQMKQNCPNKDQGCNILVSPIEIQQHLLECSYTKSDDKCIFSDFGCVFTSTSQSLMDIHLTDDVMIHLKLLVLDWKQSQYKTKTIGSNQLWDVPVKTDTVSQEADNLSNIATSTNDLLKVLYERVVVLEQQNREQGLKIDNLCQQLTKTCQISDVEARYSNGVIIWKIAQFQSKVNVMSSNPNVMFYSRDAYTSPYGYRFCVRINISPKFKDFIGLHVHMMKSDNDYHLDWPFCGRIKISLIHTNKNETQDDTIMSKPEILAFHRPNLNINPRGFGFLEYANIRDLTSRGFIVADALTLKVQINTV